jgi:ERF superfamily
MSDNLLQRINSVRKSISYIQKDKSVSTGAGGGSYRAVTHDTVTAMVRQHMIEHGIVSWPHLVDSLSMPYEVNAEMVRAKQFRYEATYDFTFANVDDPKDFIVIRIQAHAMDNADKAPGKALSYAKKYALLKMFEIETGEDEESRFKEDGMDEDDYGEHLKAIDDAPTIEALQAVFSTAYQEAKAAKDKDAAKTFIKSKDARKVALLGAAK